MVHCIAHYIVHYMVHYIVHHIVHYMVLHDVPALHVYARAVHRQCTRSARAGPYSTTHFPLGLRSEMKGVSAEMRRKSSSRKSTPAERAWDGAVSGLRGVARGGTGRQGAARGDTGRVRGG